MTYPNSSALYQQEPSMRSMIFRDRIEAGKLLAQSLTRYAGANALVLALPRGGVPVGYEVARALDIPLDVFIARKLGAPSQPELGIGAIAPGGVIVLDIETINALGIPREAIERIATVESSELDRRLQRFRGQRPMPDLHGQIVILVDDGLATGVTATAAARALRKMHPRKIVLAVPVCASQTAAALSKEVDELVCVETPANFGAVGLWYRDFEQTTDEEVVELLEDRRRRYEQKHNGGEEAEQFNGQEADGSSASAQPPRDELPPTAPTLSENASLEQAAQIPADGVVLQGDLLIPAGAKGLILFAHGSGSSRRSPRNRYVAQILHDASLGSLLMDLLTEDEEAADNRTRHLRFDIRLLASRLTGALDWLGSNPATSALQLGLFGASTGAAAALVAATNRPEKLRAVVSRGGRPDLAGSALRNVKAPTLLIVGGLDYQVIGLNREALEQLPPSSKMIIIPGATHLFEEPGKLEEVARLATAWFSDYLAPRA